VNLLKKLFAVAGIAIVAGAVAGVVLISPVGTTTTVGVVHAQFDTNGSKLPLATNNTNLSTATNGKDAIIHLANSAISLILLIVGIVAVFYLIYCGFQYLTAGGDAAKVKEARAGIVNAVIGIIIILSAFLIVRFAASLGNTVASSDSTTGASAGGGSGATGNL